MSNSKILFIIGMRLWLIQLSRLQTPFETFEVKPECFGTDSSECYLMYRGSYSWFGAHARCHSQGLALASFASKYGTEQWHNESQCNTWFVNAHSIWYNASGPALEDGTLLTAVGKGIHVRIAKSSNGNCYKLYEFEFSSIDCKELIGDVHFGCKLRADIDYSTREHLSKCPSEWQTPEVRGFRIPLCVLEMTSMTNWDAAQGACIARGGSLFGVRNDLEALWFEQQLKRIRLQHNISSRMDFYINLHEFLYCTDGWCWNDGKRNLSAILLWASGIFSLLI